MQYGLLHWLWMKKIIVVLLMPLIADHSHHKWLFTIFIRVSTVALLAFEVNAPDYLLLSHLLRITFLLRVDIIGAEFSVDLVLLLLLLLLMILWKIESTSTSVMLF